VFPTALAVRDHNQALVKRYKTDVQNAVLCDAFNFVQQPLMASDHDMLHSDLFRLSSSMHARLLQCMQVSGLLLLCKQHSLLLLPLQAR